MYKKSKNTETLYKAILFSALSLLSFLSLAFLSLAHFASAQEKLLTEDSKQQITEPLSNPFPFKEAKQESADVTKFTYNIDPEHSSIAFRVKHLGFSWVEGNFRDYYGTFVFNPDLTSNSKTNIAIRANSIDTASVKRDKHLRSADFLDYGNYKKIFFISDSFTKVDDNNYKLKGVLTIKDIQREVTLDAKFMGIIDDPWGNQRAAFDAKTVINRKDYKLSWNRVLESGSLLVGEEIEIQLYIQGILAKDNTPKLTDPENIKPKIKEQ